MSHQTPLQPSTQWPPINIDQIHSFSTKRPAPFEITNRPVKARRIASNLDSFYNHGIHKGKNDDYELALAPSTRIPGIQTPSHTHKCHEIELVRAPNKMTPSKGTITHGDRISTQSDQGRGPSYKNPSGYATSITTGPSVNLPSNPPQFHAVTAQRNTQNADERNAIRHVKALSSTTRLSQPCQFTRSKQGILESRNQSQPHLSHQPNSSTRSTIGSQERPIVIDDGNNSFDHEKSQLLKRPIAKNLSPTIWDPNASMPSNEDNPHSILTQMRMETASSSTARLDGVSLSVAEPSVAGLPSSEAASSTPQSRMFQGVLARQRARYLPEVANDARGEMSQEASPLEKPRGQIPNRHQQPHNAAILNGRKLPSKSVQRTARHDIHKGNKAMLAPQQSIESAPSAGLAACLSSHSAIHSTKTDSASKASISTHGTRHQPRLDGTVSSNLSQDFAVAMVDTPSSISGFQCQNAFHSPSPRRPSIEKSKLPDISSSNTSASRPQPVQSQPVLTIDPLHGLDTSHKGEEFEEMRARLLQLRQRQKNARQSVMAEQAEVQRRQRETHAPSIPRQTNLAVVAAPTQRIGQTTDETNAMFESMRPPAASMGTVGIEQAAALIDGKHRNGGLLDRIAKQAQTDPARLTLRPKYDSTALTTTDLQPSPARRASRPDGRKNRHHCLPIAPEKVTDDDWTIFTLHNQGMSFRDMSEEWENYSDSRHHPTWFHKRYKRMTLTYPDLVPPEGPAKKEPSNPDQRAREQCARNADIVERLRKGENALDLIISKQGEDTTKLLHETIDQLPARQTTRQTTGGKSISKDLAAFMHSIANNEEEEEKEEEEEEEEEEDDAAEHFRRQASPPAPEEDAIHYAYTVKRRTLRTDQTDADWYICGKETDDLCEANAMAAAELQKPRNSAVWPLTSWTYNTNHDGTGMLSCHGSCSQGSVEIKVDRMCRTVDQGFHPKSKLRWFNREVWDVLMKESTVEQVEEWAEEEVQETELDCSDAKDFEVIESPSEDAIGIEPNTDAASDAGTDMDSLFGDGPKHLLPTPASSFDAHSNQETEDAVPEVSDNFSDSDALKDQNNEEPTAQPALHFDDGDCAMVDADLPTECKDSQKNVSTPERSHSREIGGPVKKVRTITRIKHIIRHTTTTIKHVGGIYGSLDRANRHASRVYLDFIRKMDRERKHARSMEEYERCKAEDADMSWECDELDEGGDTFYRAVAMVEDDEIEEAEEEGTPIAEFWVENRRLENPRNLC